MALKMNYAFNKRYLCVNSYSTVPDEKYITELYSCYFVIESIRGGKNSIVLTVCGYDGDAKTNKIYEKGFAFTPSVADGSENFIRQGYEYLKTLPEFAGASDC